DRRAATGGEMTDPREPGPPEDDPGIALPSWVDDAIAKSRHDAPDGTAPPDPRPAGEIAVNPLAMGSETPTADWRPVGPDAEASPPVVLAPGPNDARRRAVLPWVALALIFLGAALAVGYILLTRSVQR